MRLLNTETGKLHWFDRPPSRYAILSHVWAQNYGSQEQTFRDVRRLQEETPPGQSVLSRLSPKMRGFCDEARKMGLPWGWVDSYCINQADAAELQDALNSMFDWYKHAEVCFAYLQDVNVVSSAPTFAAQFQGSKWFDRGWTLQELLAPRVVHFFSSDWQPIGTKATRAELIESRTKIDRDVLTLQKSLWDLCVAKRMSWAAFRCTTRAEDWAYSLMGIFDVHMHTNYGEGLEKAFFRLQEEILRKHPDDHSIFVWGSILPLDTLAIRPCHHVSPLDRLRGHRRQQPTVSPAPSLFASSPRDFLPWSWPSRLVLTSPVEPVHRAGASTNDLRQNTSPGTVTTRLPLAPVYVESYRGSTGTIHIALTACQDPSQGCLALLLPPPVHHSSNTYVVGSLPSFLSPPYANSPEMLPSLNYCTRMAVIAHEQVLNWCKKGVFKMTNISFATPVKTDPLPQRTVAAVPPRTDLNVRLARPSVRLLQDTLEYSINPSADVDIGLGRQTLADHWTAPGLVLSKGDTDIHIHVGRCGCEYGEENGALGVLVSSTAGASSYPGAEAYVNDTHGARHPIHLISWEHEKGRATRTFEFASTLRLRLSIGHLPSGSGGDILLSVDSLEEMPRSVE